MRSRASSGSSRKRSAPVGVIAGTGVAEHFDLSKPIRVTTKYGRSQVYGAGGDYVLARHGPGHAVPPHMVNYRANLAALKKLGVRSVIATSAVGSMLPAFGVGELGLLDQFIDFTKGRDDTYFDGEVAHTDMTNPYSAKVNGALAKAAGEVGVKLRPGLVYVCAEGPRFETAAEIRMFRAMGGDVVGMTGVPEVVLARELGMEYSTVVVATNWAAGMQERVSHEEVVKAMKKAGPKVKGLIVAAVRLLREAQDSG